MGLEIGIGWLSLLLFGSLALLLLQGVSKLIKDFMILSRKVA
jgi:TRAP-type mannitol/chloroaromatic compound transport system permease small subunit